MLFKIQIMFFCLVLISCSSSAKKEMYPIEMVNWFNLEKESMNHEKIVGDYYFKLQFIPSEIKILTEVDNPNVIEKKYYDERINELNDKVFCFFEIGPVNQAKSFLETETSNLIEYGSRLNYFVTYAQQDFYMIQGKDTMKCLTYHFENTYGLKKSNTISMLFDKKNNTKDMEFIFDDKILNTGPIIFTQKSFSKTNTPTIKFK